jgi:hypothetical protein
MVVITGIWYAIEHDENIEFHTTRATGCVCRECWKIYSDIIIGSLKIEENTIGRLNCSEEGSI